MPSIGSSACTRERGFEGEHLAAFYHRIAPQEATEVLKDLAELLPEDATPQDYVDLGETQAFAPEVMDGECAS